MPLWFSVWVSHSSAGHLCPAAHCVLIHPCSEIYIKHTLLHTHTHSRTRSENTDTEHAHKVGWGRLQPFKRKIILDPYSAHVVGTPSNYPKHAQKKVLMLAYSCRISHTYTHTHLSNMARLVIVKVRISRSFTKLFLFAI